MEHGETNSHDEVAAKRTQLQAIEEARSFDAELRHIEEQERADRLAKMTRPRQSPDGASELLDDSIRVVQLEARVSELNAYLRAVHESLPWRIIQSIRRIFGRAW